LDGTDPQAPLNQLHIHEAVQDVLRGLPDHGLRPSILFNEGYNDVFEVCAKGSLLNPAFPAPISNRLNVHTRFFDCQSGALGQRARICPWPRLRTSPYLVFSGTIARALFQMVELCSRPPGRPAGDGLDVTLVAAVQATRRVQRVEFPYSHRELRAGYGLGGAGLHRGGTASRSSTYSWKMAWSR